MMNLLKKHKFFILGLLILSWVVFINLFPRDYVIVGGDTNQLIDLSKNFKRIFYEWNGLASLFYFIFYIIDNLGVSNSNQLSFYLGLFVFGSYISFWISTFLLNLKVTYFQRMALSLFYALNIYTLYIFTYTWGYSHYQIFYVFIPVLVGLYIKFLKSENFLFAAFFSLVLFFSSSGFANPAFALSFSILIMLLTVALAITGQINFGRKILLGLFFLFLVSVFINAYWILPIMPRMNAGVSNIFSGNAIDFNWWLAHTSNPIIGTLRFSQDSSWYFPENFPYKNILFLKNFFIFISLIPAILISLSLFLIRDKTNRKIFIAFMGIFLFFVVFVAKVRPPFEVLNHYFYNIWGINTLRGYEKFAIYTPFILTILISLFFIEIKKFKRIYFFLFVLLLLCPLPFYIGKIQQNMSAQFYAYKIQNMDYRKADHSFLVKIPEEYYKIKDVINSDKSIFFVTSLPYAREDSWTDYPKWKLYGVDITRLLYDKNYLNVNSIAINSRTIAKDFNEQSEGDFSWIIKTLGAMNAKYIIYHKDVAEDLIKETKSKMDVLEEGGFIKELEDNKYFTLYKIKESYLIPYISWQKEKYNIRENLKLLNSDLDKIRENSSTANFILINPKKIIISPNEAFNNLIIAEPYDKNWKAYYLTDKGKEIEIKDHFLARGYANGWRIEPGANNEQILIEYYPARLLKYGITISLATTLFLTCYLLRYAYVQRKSQRNFC